jgi:hypothetical protein
MCLRFKIDILFHLSTHYFLKKGKNSLYLKGLGHEIRIALKWYGLIGLG